MKTKLFFLFTFLSVVLMLNAQNQHRLDSITYKYYDPGNGNFALSGINKFTYSPSTVNTTFDIDSWDQANSVFYTQMKQEYTHDSNGNVLTRTLHYWTGTSLDPYLKYLYSFDPNGRITEKIEQSYNTGTSSFENSQREVYTYANSSDPLPSQVQLDTWDTGSASWQFNQRAMVTYNANGHFLTLVLENYDSSNNIWINYKQWTRTYDSNGRITQQLEEEWNGTAWVNNNRYDNTYTSSSGVDRIEHISQWWDQPNTQWVNSGKQIFEVDSSTGEMLVQEYYYWDSFNTPNAWKGSQKKVYNYNANIIEEVSYFWDHNTNDWLSDSTYKRSYVYDMSVPNSDLVLPVDEQQPSYFDLNNEVFNKQLPSFDLFKHKLLVYRDYSRPTVTDPWQESNNGTYMYSSILSVNQLPTISGKVFPNPFNNYIKVEVEADKFDITLTDIAGRQVYQANHLTNETINLPDLQTGIYVYEIKTINGIKKGKLIKK